MSKVIIVVNEHGDLLDRLDLPNWVSVDDLHNLGDEEHSDSSYVYSTIADAICDCQAEGGAVIELDPDNPDDFTIYEDYRYHQKYVVYVNIVGGLLDEIRLFPSFELADQYFQKAFPNCGSYEEYREWLELSHG
jgi:hypothetical protein